MLPSPCRALPVAMLLSAALVACDAAEADVACLELAPGVRVVTVAAERSLQPPQLQLEEVWRAGGSTPGQELIMPASVALSRSGHVAVVDHQLAEVFVIDPAGAWLGSWGRRGRGPGELVMPIAANWRGDTLLVFDIMQAKVASYVAGVVDAEMAVASVFVAPVIAQGEVGWVGVEADGSVLMGYPVPRPATGTDSVELHLARQRPAAAVADTLLSTRTRTVTTPEPVAQPGGPVPVAAVGPDGWLATAAPDGSYRVLVRGPDGLPSHQLCRRVSPLPLTAAELGREPIAGFEHQLAAIAAAQPAGSPRGIGRLIVGASGELWVQRSRPAPYTDQSLFGVPGATMDVYDRTGSFRGEIVIPSDTRVLGVVDSMAVGVRFSELDEASIVGLRVRPRGSRP